tara:strand:- start:399 stop:623 length:225 start_codon:yes stop_codon:yes gene_type:complete
VALEEKDDYIRNAHGWIDDFSAPPGACGHPFTRKLYAYSCLKQGMTIADLRQMGYSREMVTDVLKMIMDQEWDQ